LILWVKLQGLSESLFVVFEIKAIKTEITGDVLLASIPQFELADWARVVKESRQVFGKVVIDLNL